MRKLLWVIAASCSLLLSGYFGFRAYNLDTQPWIIAGAGMVDGQWKGNVMTIAQYEQYIKSEDGLTRSFERLYPGRGLQDASQKKLMAAKNRVSNQTLLALLFASVASFGFFMAFGRKLDQPENAGLKE